MSARPRAFAVSLVVTAVALYVRWLLEPFLPERLPYVTFFIAVTIVVWHAGLWPALFSMLLGCACALLFFIPPKSSLAVLTIPDAVGLAMYFSVSLSIIAFGEATRAARRRAQDAYGVADREKRLFRQTLLGIGDAVIATDARGTVTLLNVVAEKLTGWNESEAQGHDSSEVFRIVNEETGEPADSPVQRVLESGEVVGLANHTLLIARDGTQRPIADSAAPIIDDGKIVGVVLVFRDTTDRRAAQRMLSESENRKAAMLASALDAIVGIDDRGRVVEFNPAAERMFGVRHDHALGKEMAELVIPPRLRDSHRRGMARYLLTGEEHVLNRHVELVGWQADGGEFPVEASITRIQQPGTAAFVGYIRDISTRKRGELDLEWSERRFRALLLATTSIVWTTDRSGNFVTEQESWSGFTGQTWEEYRGRGWVDALHPEDRPLLLASWARAVSTRSSYRGEARLWHARTRRYRYVEAQAVPLFEGEAVREWFGMCLDVDKEKRLEEQLHQYISDLSDADRRKDEFLAMLAHELRNPLAPIVNMLAVLRRGDTSDAVRERAQAMMERQIGQIVHLVDDLLDVGRISQGKFELRKEPVELTSVIGHAVEAARPLCDEEGQELSLVLPPDPIFVHADRNRLAQVIGNLLNNSCKYTPRGGHVSLVVEQEEHEAVIRVRDDGIGIDPEHLARIFELFVQVDSSLERSRSGLGIGLTLVKRITSLHGGTVTAFSAGHGRGSEFVVRLPIMAEAPRAVAPDQPVSSRPSTPSARTRILVVDDNRDAAESLALSLKLDGYETHTAHDGREALRMAAALLPRAILLDIGLPKLNGHEVARRLRREPWGKDVALVALTGWGQDADRSRSAEAGFDAHLVKPVDHETLTTLLSRLTAPPEGA